jgi:hypothetical protein
VNLVTLTTGPSPPIYSTARRDPTSHVIGLDVPDQDARLGPRHGRWAESGGDQTNSLIICAGTEVRRLPGEMFYGSLLYLPSWSNFCYISCLMKSLTEFCMGLICRTKNRNAKTGNLLVYSQASSCLCFRGSIPFPSGAHRVMKTFSGSSCSSGTVGPMCSCVFGLLYMTRKVARALQRDTRYMVYCTRIYITCSLIFI